MANTKLAIDKHRHPIQALKPGTTQSISVTSASDVVTNAFSSDTVVIRVVSTTGCFIAIGTGTPSASANDMYIPSYAPEYFRIDGNETLKLAAIRESVDGTIYITEML